MEYSKSASQALGLISTTRALIVAVRPRQWSKNLIIYMAFFFTVNEAWDFSHAGDTLSLLGRTTLAFLIFSALTGAIYLINDIYDLEKDRLHPKKRMRPIASGRLSIPTARGAAIVLMTVGLASSVLLEPEFGGVSLAYVLSMIAYTVLIKRLILLDVFVISAGFVLRAVAGAVVLDVPISPWLLICTGLGALFLALAKRRSELSTAGENATSQRDSLEVYTVDLLDQFIVIVATSTLIAYSLYTFTASNLPDNHALMLTIPFVVYGLFRYMFLMHKSDAGENPEELLLGDAPLIATIVLWVASAATILALYRG